MSARPWDPDWVATPAALKAVLRSQFPRVGWEALRHLGSGWEFDAWVTSDGWVFRFPRRREAVAQLDREGPILDLVRPALAPEVAVPRPELRGEPEGEVPYPFAGHRMLPGVAADHPGLPESPDLPAQLGRALGRLHAVDPDQARAAGLPEDREGLAEWQDEIVERVGELEGISREVDAFVARLGEGLPLPPPYEAPLRVLHNDLGPDHVLRDRDTGALVGLLDWTDASLGDPTLDFVFLVTWRGWAMAEAVLERYPLPLDPDVRRRLSGMARIRSLVGLQEAVVRDGDVEKHLRWVRNGFSGPDPGGAVP